MANSLHYPWHIYAKLQKESLRSRRITSRSWGLETSLTEVLKAFETGTISTSDEALNQEIARKINQGVCNERNHARLRLKHPPIIDFEPNPEDRLIAAIMLRNIQKQLHPDDWRLLYDVAQGSTYEELAEMLGMSVGSLRTRVSRLRAKLLN